jgi:hypothetical protein
MPQLMANGGRPQSEAGQWRLSFSGDYTHNTHMGRRPHTNTLAECESKQQQLAAINHPSFNCNPLG